MHFKSRLLILAGVGPLLRIFDQAASTLICSKVIFDNQTIHGIKSVSDNRPLFESEKKQILVWGGYSICVFQLSNPVDEEEQGFKIQKLSKTLAEDQIIDACFVSHLNHGGRVEKSLIQALLVTSHNAVLCLHYTPESSPACARNLSLTYLTASPCLMLYSAHIVLTVKGHVLIAVGTVLGEVLVWSFSKDDACLSSKIPDCNRKLHYTFNEHEGSVFGVRISEEFACAESISAKRFVASCSDDRTIRVWDISSLDDEIFPKDCYEELVASPESSARSTIGSEARHGSLPCLAAVMGHSSRIWDLRFLDQRDKYPLLISFGEDATAQVWCLTSELKNDKRNYFIQHYSMFTYHSGKNIWAADVYEVDHDTFLVATGGADARVVCKSFERRQGMIRNGDSHSLKWTSEHVVHSSDDNDSTPVFEEVMAAKTHIKILPSHVFAALEGQWELSRNLSSSVLDYLSGMFVGTAIFKKRLPTHNEYDAEYLYTEIGQFNTNQGLKLTANRSYAYRFQKSANIISVWFVKADNESTVDYLFHEIDFTSFDQESYSQMGRPSCLLKANGRHHCVDDDYQANYLFQFCVLQCHEWNLKYVVHGPRKNYIANGKYVRSRSRSDSMPLSEERTFDALHKIPDVTEANKERTVSSYAGSFRSYTWIDKNLLLVSTEHGHVYLANFGRAKDKRDSLLHYRGQSDAVWEKIGNLVDMKASCLATNVRNRRIAIFAGGEGTLSFYLHDLKTVTHSQIRIPGKPSSLGTHLLDTDSKEPLCDDNSRTKLGMVVACLQSPTAYLFRIDVSTAPPHIRLLSSLSLMLAASFVVTSSCFIERDNILILGSRNGALAFYDILADQTDTNSIAHCLILSERHGKDAITSIEQLPADSNDITMKGTYFLTTGRNGAYSLHFFQIDRSSTKVSTNFQTVHVSKPPFGPNIEGACFDQVTHDLLVWGFRGKDFVLWNETQKSTTMTVECGGAHRTWAFSLNNYGNDGGDFAWTKASACHVYMQQEASHQVLQRGSHGREVKAMALSPLIRTIDGVSRRFIATGAEDTTIQISSVPKMKEYVSHENLVCLEVITKHTTGLQQIHWSSNGQLLFSAGGCEEFFVWRIRPVPSIKIGVVCEAQCPPLTKRSDLRIMDFAVSELSDTETASSSLIFSRYLLTMVYSDSTIRVSQMVPMLSTCL